MATQGLEAKGQMALYREKQTLPFFLTRFFKPVKGSTGSTAKTLTWDIVRYTDKIAGTIDPGTGAHINTVQKFSTKELSPPEYHEAFSIDARDLVNRMAGENQFDASSRSFRARFAAQAAESMAQSAGLIDRGMELQASQILQTGQLDLPGEKPFVVDYRPKSSHFPTASILWSNAGTAVPLNDIENLATQIKTDSRQRMVQAIMGRTALREFLDSDQVQAQADLRRINTMDIAPVIDEENGAHMWGTVSFNGYVMKIWQYDAEFEPLAGGANVPYVDEENVILLPANTSGLVVASLLVPRIVPPDPRVASMVGTPTTSSGGWDLTPNVWVTDQGNVVSAGFQAQPVLIPQGIDEFGTLST